MVRGLGFRVQGLGFVEIHDLGAADDANAVHLKMI